MIRVDVGNEGGVRRKDIFNENEQRLLWLDLDTLPNYVRELPNSEVVGNQILLLVDAWNITPVCFLDNDLNEGEAESGW